jgi:two-component sensor histidine kinase
MKSLFAQVEDPRTLAEIIIDTVREPLLVLDGNSKILFASGSFHRWFEISPEDTHNRSLFALDNGAWDIAGLRVLLERTVPEYAVVKGFAVEHEFPRIGWRSLLLHARKAFYEGSIGTIILLGFEDVTERRAVEVEREALQEQTHELLLQKEMLLGEMQHRVLNSLQIIASILMLKARAVTSEETRQHLQDAHRRVMSVAAVQQHLHSSGAGDRIEIAPYLSKLCDSLSGSMISEGSSIVLQVVADKDAVAPADAVSLGLIVTELVINALKYAFPDQPKLAAVTVRYEVNGTDWKLSVSDNGVGRPEGTGTTVKGGLGTSLVKALAHQLDAQVDATSGPEGMSVSITHATFTAATPQAA